jgi:hypothetical protein
MASRAVDNLWRSWVIHSNYVKKLTPSRDRSQRRRLVGGSSAARRRLVGGSSAQCGGTVRRNTVRR